MICGSKEQKSLAFLIALTILFSSICVSANNNDDDGIDGDNVLKIAQSCAPKSRSRRAVTVDRMTMTCAENEEQSASCSVGGFAQVTVDCEFKRCACFS